MRESDLPQPLGTSLRAAITVTIIGMAVGVLMIVQGAHTVGARDGGPGLVLTDWSSHHGDLRVAHFVGLHALEVITLSTWLMTKVAPALAARRGQHLVRVGAVFYTGVIAPVSTASCALVPVDQLGLRHPAANASATGQTVLVWGGCTSVQSAATSFLVVCLRYGMAAPAAPRRRLAALSSSSIQQRYGLLLRLATQPLDHRIHHRISQTDH